MVLELLITFFGAIVAAAGTIIQRTILRKKKIDIKLYQAGEFLGIILAMLPFIYFFWRLDAQAFQTKNLLLFGLVIVFAIIANVFSYYSMKWEKVSNLEPAKILEPLFVILLAIGFSFILDATLYQRNLNIIIPALIASIALVFSHIKKHHLEFNKYFIAAILGSFFFALELVISRLILDFYSPITFYFLRCAIIFIITMFIFKPKLKRFNKKIKWELLGLGLIWAIYRVVIYYGYIHLGVVFTTLMIMLGPLFIYVFAWKFLKEKLDWKNIVAAIVIIASILYAVLI
jgi:drug/metabolite transporter (DMT)-like permease